MKKLLLIILGALLVLPAAARDFSYEYQGQTLTYTVLDEDAKTVEVAKKEAIEGALVIPATAKYDDIEYSVTSIGHMAFSNCSALTSIEIPNSVTDIGEYAFLQCYSLTSIVIPNSVTAINYCTFGNCTALATIEIPNSVTAIHSTAFLNCSSLTSIVIPSSVTALAYQIFTGCSNLISIEASAENPNYASVDGVLFSKDLSTLIQYPIGKSGGYEVPNTVTAIGDSAFDCCGAITSITMPNSVISIGRLAFQDCTALTSIEIPNSVTSISKSAFRLCSSLTSIVIPNSITLIDDEVFYGCSGLTSVVIPNSVTAIGSEAFGKCSSLTSIEIPNSVASISSNAFSECSSLTSIEVSAENPEYSSLDGVLFNKDLSTLILFPSGRSGEYDIPTSVTTIGNSAFGWNTTMTSINIPNTVTSIGDFAFYGCSGLTSISIPNSVTSIGDRAFYGWDPTSVYYGADDPIEASYFTFYDTTYRYATLYLSEKGAKKVQDQDISPWCRFRKIEVYDFSTDGIEDAVAEFETDMPCEIYSLSGAKVGNSTDALAPGIYIMRQGTAVKKIAVK